MYFLFCHIQTADSHQTIKFESVDIVLIMDEYIRCVMAHRVDKMAELYANGNLKLNNRHVFYDLESGGVV
jgi:hypothetical protein